MAYTVNQLPAPVDFNLVSGDDFTATITLNMDITGYTFAAVVDTTPVATNFTVAVIDAITGKLTITLTAAQTAGITSATSWDMRWTDPDTKKLTIFCGTVTPRC